MTRLLRRWAPLATSLAVLAGVLGCDSSASRDVSIGPARQPDAGRWATWVLASPDEITVPPPPEPSSPPAHAEADELRRLATRRGPEVDAVVRRWAQDPIFKPWTELNLDQVAAHPTDPPGAARGNALVHVAIHDAVVATWHWKYVYRRQPPAQANRLSPPGPDPSYPSEHAAVAGAASRVLAYLFPERSPASLEEMAEEAAMSRVWAGANRRSDVRAGLDLGRAVAAKVIERGRSDGSAQPWDGSRPPLTPAYWQPPPGTNRPPVQPRAGTWKPWVLSTGSQLRPAPPPPYGSPEFVAETREVMDVKAKLTAEQMALATAWGAGEGTALPPGMWNGLALAYLGRARLSTPHAARAFALVNAALSDAAIASWDAKYTWWSPRPVNAIRDLGLDPEWTPYLRTPPFPSYVSGHATFSGAASEVLAYLLPDHAEVFRRKAEEATASRLYGGIHFRSDNYVGLSVGRRIGQLVIERARKDGA